MRFNTDSECIAAQDKAVAILPGCFSITFENGIFLSILNNSGAYTEDRNLKEDPYKYKFDVLSGYATNTVEVMVTKADYSDGEDEKFFGTDKIQGWMAPDELAKLMAFCASAPKHVHLDELGDTYRRLIQ